MNDDTTPEVFHRLLAEYWGDIQGRLDEASRRELGALVEDLSRDPDDVLADIEDLLLDALPGDHPVIRHLANRLMFQAPSVAGEEARRAHAQAWLRAQVLGRQVPEPPSQYGVPPVDTAFDDLFVEVQARLLALPSYTVEQLVEVRPEEWRWLIRLRGDDRILRTPRFQFQTGSARPIPVVLETNKLLDIGIDPWGATSWWVDAHEVIDGSPVDLLGTGRETLLPVLAGRLGED